MPGSLGKVNSCFGGNSLTMSFPSSASVQTAQALPVPGHGASSLPAPPRSRLCESRPVCPRHGLRCPVHAALSPSAMGRCCSPALAVRVPTRLPRRNACLASRDV